MLNKLFSKIGILKVGSSKDWEHVNTENIYDNN